MTVHVFTQLGGPHAGHGWADKDRGPGPSCPFAGPTRYAIDGRRFMPSPDEHGRVAVHHEGDWTAVVIADRSGDHRGNSKTAVVIRGTVTAADAIAAARSAYPRVMARLEAYGPVILA